MAISFATFFGANYPAESDVVNTAPTYGDAINVLDGTLDPGAGGTVPSASDVRFGVAVGATTGLLDLPSVDDVRLAVTFDQTTKTGNVRVPPVEKVEAGYLYDTNDTLTGTLDPGAGGTVPAASDVRFGVAVGATTGLAYIPTASETLLGVNVDQATGTVRLPPETNVLLGFAYGPSDTLTGELDPGSGTCLGYPLEDEVLSGVVFGNASELTGNRTDALEEDVRLGKSYAASGVSKTGTWNGETGEPGDQTWIGQ